MFPGSRDNYITLGVKYLPRLECHLFPTKLSDDLVHHKLEGTVLEPLTHEDHWRMRTTDVHEKRQPDVRRRQHARHATGFL